MNKDLKANKIVKIDDLSPNWYFLIFTDSAVYNKDTTELLGSKNYEMYNLNQLKDSVIVLNQYNKIINEQLVLVGFRTISKYKIFQFYNPHQKDYLNLKGTKQSNIKYPVELDGQVQLEKILSNIK